MNIIELLAKVTAGKELTAEEVEFLKAYKEPKVDSGKIPKERLDQEIAKRKKLDEELKAKTKELEDLQNKDLSDLEKLEKERDALQKQVDALTSERDMANAELDKMKLRNAITDLAREHKFNDPDYLAYKIKAAGLDVNDAEKTKEFMENMKKDDSLQHFFAAPGKSGGGSKSGGVSHETKLVGKARMDELLKKEDLTKQEAAEVVALQEKLREKE